MSLCYICEHHPSTDNGHVLARARGGSLDPSNIRRICKTCNSRMGTQHMDDYKKKYDEGRTPSVVEFNPKPVPYKERIPLSNNVWKDRLIEFIEAYHRWPIHDDEYAPSTVPKRKKNHVLHGLYNIYTQKERADWIAFLKDESCWNYQEFRSSRRNKLSNKKYKELEEIATKYGLSFDRVSDREPWLCRYRVRQRGGDLWYDIPKVKDRVYRCFNDF